MIDNPSFTARIPEVSVQRLIVSKVTLKGDGVPKDPYRRVLAFYTLEGEVIAEVDPHEPSGRALITAESLLVDAPKVGPFYVVKLENTEGWGVRQGQKGGGYNAWGTFTHEREAQMVADNYNLIWKEGWRTALNANP